MKIVFHNSSAGQPANFSLNQLSFDVCEGEIQDKSFPMNSLQKCCSVLFWSLKTTRLLVSYYNSFFVEIWNSSRSRRFSYILFWLPAFLDNFPQCRLLFLATDNHTQKKHFKSKCHNSLEFFLCCNLKQLR